MPQRGFGMISIMIGGCILGLFVACLYGTYSFGFALIRMSQEDVRADQTLVQKLETLPLYNWSQSQPTIAGGIIPATFTNSFALRTGSPRLVYDGAIAVGAAPVAESHSNTLRQATITVIRISGKFPCARSISIAVS